MAFRRSWHRSMRRELHQQWREHGFTSRFVLLLAVLSSAGVAAWLLSSQQLLLDAQQRQRDETHRGLLDLRITGHKVTALDWGHWTPLYRFAGGEDPGFVAREVLSSSIIRDDQLLLIATNDGQVERLPNGVVPQALQACLQKRLAMLRQFLAAGKPGQNPLESDKAYGLFCPAAGTAYLGAVTAIFPSAGVGHQRGWLLHLSKIERGSYNQAVNLTFRVIGNSLFETAVDGQDSSHRGRWSADRRVDSIGELLPYGQAYLLRPLRTPLQRRLVALERTLAPWMILNGLLISGAGVGMLSLRQLRRQHLLKERQHQSRLRALRHQLAGPLLTTEQLVQALAGNPAPSGWWIVALGLKVQIHSGDSSRSQAHTHALRQLSEILQQLAEHRHLALTDDSKLVWVLEPRAGELAAAELLAQQLHGLRQVLAKSMRIRIKALLCPVDWNRFRQQLIDLSLVLASQSAEPEVVTMDVATVFSEAERLRQRRQQDFDLNQWIEELEQPEHRLEPVVELDQVDLPWSSSAGQGRLVYSEMLFRLPVSLVPNLSIQELILSLERHHNVHRVDQLMLAKAAQLLQGSHDHDMSVAINLSARTFSSDQHFQNMLARLRSLPQSERKRLVLEVTETAIVEHPDQWAPKLQDLRDLGVRIAIDDFGVGFASIAYLFRFRADFIKLDLSYSQRLADPNVEALVSFLLAYCRHNQCQLILEGIETSEQLLHWHALGVRLFQGFLLCDEPHGP